MAKALRADPIPESYLVSLRVPDREGISIYDDRVKFILRLRGDQSIEAVDCAGIKLPRRALNSVSHDGGKSYWLGPDEWLIAIGAEQEEHLIALITSALESGTYALVDVSSQLVEFGIVGRHSHSVLRSFTPLDLDIGSFPFGHVARTAFGKTEVILAFEREPDDFRLFVSRSYAPYVLRLLCLAGAEFAIGISSDINKEASESG